MVDYLIKENEIPIWKVTLDEEYVGLVDLQTPERKSYIVTKFMHDNTYLNYKFKIQTDRNNEEKTYTEFIIPNPKNQQNLFVLVEITEYKKLFFKSNRILDMKFLHMEKAFLFSRSSSQNSFS